MRVLQINKHHFIKGGADRVYFNTGNLLAENQHEIIYFSTNHPNNFNSQFSDFFVPYSDNRQAGFARKVVNAGTYLNNRTAYKNLNKLISKYNPDIAHLHLFYGGLSTSVLKSLKENNVPVVQSVHDYRLLCPANAFLDSGNQICEKCKNRSYYQCTVKRCSEGDFFYSSILSLEAYTRKYFIDPLDYIDRFIFVSKFSQEKHIEFDNRYSEKSNHLYNFTDVRRDQTTAQKGNYFLFFGRLSEEKGLLTLINAAKKLKLNLKIAGTGPLETEVVRSTANNRHIEFLGYQSGADLSEVIKKSLFIIVPSEWYENNPMTIIEAYAYGIPVIGSRIGGIPEIVIENKTGFLFESRNEDDLIRAIEKAGQLNSAEYADLSLNARNFAERNFSSGNHYSALMGIYSKVLKNV
jgi:glycosyltransferase involved in cell wall biosynthesis